MTTTNEVKRSTGYWIIAVFALVWNLIGAFFWYLQVTMSAEQLALMTAPQRQVYEGTPGWIMSTVGAEKGVTTGRSRRCGWFDAALLKRSAQINGLSGLCITKLDVLDGLTELLLCTGYELDGERIDLLPMGAEDIARCTPIYETLPGWSDSTVGVTDYDKLPASARRYLERIEEVTGVPIDMISTSPDRDHTIMMRHPYVAV